MNTLMKHGIFLTAALTVFVAVSHADVIELKNGKKLTGKYAGGTAGSVGFETSEGMQFFETGQIVALSFGNGSTGTPSPSGATQTSPAPAVAPAAPAAYRRV